jgi:8-oxo-dGTP diphosphatase
MNFVYILAFNDDLQVLMVKHARRSWEMPGGRIEPGETPEEAVVREFLEETGRRVELVNGTIPEENGLVFCGKVGDKVGVPNPGEIIEVEFFSDLPDELSFPAVEYEKMLTKFRSVFLDHIE